jgi:hypothetical protein
MNAATIEINMEVPQETESRTTIRSGSTILGHLSKEM